MSMKHLVIPLLCALLVGSAASAQRLQFGIRGGANFTDYKFQPTTIDGTRFLPGPSRAGYEAGVVLRFNITRHLHLQSEFNYTFVNYQVRTTGSQRCDITLRSERFQIPVELGLQFGILRLFGGANFRVAQSDRSAAPRLLKVGFNNDDIGIMGGIGLNISKFFIDFRMQGYPRSHLWHTFVSNGVASRVRVVHDILYGGSLGFYF